ncbi:SDR family oxidoreductase [Mycobacterium talmoniae]|uniref:Putative oxidoreductase n=1 Tax=Mycobacterium talmoniae TaxID=1858794 RepID=A0A1S1NMN7_9MYCO|nr:MULTISPECIES: SDR family oxidoreductase [Mycobacterium]OHV05269.1 short-chain dehydrogenase [Mycobacterium talmoniae]PQM46820.1 putative oxidoreductase [Mycobacterium talmoniae]TDH52292.1 SDR family NAD(P)-dependent oxidoreductase [Mycobacterium eburneum]
MEIDGSVVVVTGGQRGLGKALVNAFLDGGAAKVYATARTPQDSADDRVIPARLDVTDPASVTAFAARAADANIVVNNAGAQHRAKLLDIDIDSVRTLFDTNVYGALRMAQSFAPVLSRNGGGTLVNVMSILSWSVGTAAGAAPYGATKAALWSLTNSLRVELAEQHTQVVGVHLGYLQTDMTTTLDIHKLDPATAAETIVSAIAAGASEVLVDEDCRRAKALLGGPPEGLAFRFVDGRISFAGDA